MWVRKAVFNWIKDVMKHLPPAHTQRGKETHLLQNRTWAAGFRGGALQARAEAEGAGAGARRW